MTTKQSDSWETPQWLFDELNQEFNFNIDLCATADNSKCTKYCRDYFSNRVDKNWNCNGLAYYDVADFREFNAAFMNPPYSNPRPFIEKAWEDSKYCKIVCLVKCDPSTKWWATFWDYELHRPKPGCEVRFLPKRVKYDPPASLHEAYEFSKRVGCRLPGPTFPSAILIFDRRE